MWMVQVNGIEPMTQQLKAVRSTTELNLRICNKLAGAELLLEHLQLNRCLLRLSISPPISLGIQLIVMQLIGLEPIEIAVFASR